MKITVIGGSGFLGSHVADALSQKGHKVIIFDKKKIKMDKKKSKNINWQYIKFTLFEKSNKRKQNSL